MNLKGKKNEEENSSSMKMVWVDVTSFNYKEKNIRIIENRLHNNVQLHAFGFIKGTTKLIIHSFNYLLTEGCGYSNIPDQKKIAMPNKRQHMKSRMNSQ